MSALDIFKVVGFVTSLIALVSASYSLYFSTRQNRRLLMQNRDLIIRCNAQQREIDRLRLLLESKGS